MSATNLFMSWTGCTYNSVTLLKVTKFAPNRNGSSEAFKGDAAIFDQLIVVPGQKRTFTLTTGDVKAAAAIAVGTDATFVIILNDPKNGVTAAGGAISYTYTHAVLVDNPAEGDHAKFASATLSFEAYALDGVTDPLTVTAL